MKPTATIGVCRGLPTYQMTGCLCISLHQIQNVVLLHTSSQLGTHPIMTSPCIIARVARGKKG